MNCPIQITRIDFPKSHQYKKKKDAIEQIIHELFKLRGMYFLRKWERGGGNM